MTSFSPTPGRRLPCPAPVLLGLCVWLGIAGCKPAGPNAPTNVPPSATHPNDEKTTATVEAEPNSSPSPPATVDTPAPTVDPPAAPSDPTAAAPSPALRPQEYWELHSMKGSRIGFAHYRIEEIQDDDRSVVRTISRSEASVQRLGQTIKQQVTLKEFSLPSGELLKAETEVAAGQGSMTTVGRMKDGAFHIELSTLGKKQTTVIPWKPEYRGMFGVEQSLRDRPMQPGEERTIITLLPILNQMGENRLKAGDIETLELPQGKRQLLKIESVTIIPAGAKNGQRIEAVIWIDENGEGLRQYVAGVGQLTERATKAQALAKNDGAPQIDLIEESVVKVSPPLKNSLETKRVVYRARVREGKIAGLFAQGISQKVTPIDAQTAEIEVTAVNAASELPVDRGTSPPTAEDSAPNSLIQSDDPRVQRLAMAGGRGVDEPIKLAAALESLVHRSIRAKNFSQAFATAAEVARSLEGDCTEHSVLLAAVCRARKLPARAAIGLVYYPPKRGFAYHMWNEVWVGDRWLPLDATLGRGGIAADHLKLVDTNLEGASAYSAMLPVVQAFGRLELEVISAE